MNFTDVLHRTSYRFHWFFSITFCFLLHLISACNSIIFLHFSCSSFSGFFKMGSKNIDLRPSFNSVHFPQSIALTASYKLWGVLFSHSFSSKYFLITCFSLLWGYLEVYGLIFKYFDIFPDNHLLLIFSLISLWPENIPSMITILSN